MTRALQISAKLDDDGQVLEDSNGHSLLDLLDAARGKLQHREGELDRHELPDGSAIIYCEPQGFWDIGITGDRLDCVCPSETGTGCNGYAKGNCDCSCHEASETL